MTAVRLRVWAMCLSATSMYSNRDVTAGFFVALRCLISAHMSCKRSGKLMRHLKLRPRSAKEGYNRLPSS